MCTVSVLLFPELTDPQTSLASRFGDYGALYKQLLEDKDQNEEWHVWYVEKNQFPTADDLQGFKAGCKLAMLVTHSLRPVTIALQNQMQYRASVSLAASMMPMQRTNGT